MASEVTSDITVISDDITLSVVVPVYNGGSQLELCLDALLASDARPLEIIVVDDCSTDASATTKACALLGVEVVRLDERAGPAAARNRGARQARGNIILFVDADVVVRRDTLARIVAFLQEQPKVAALFGSYDDSPAAQHFVSQYKNLFHHFIHQRSSMRAETFWAGCGAVRRAAFEAVGGFDERAYTRPSIEDIELGGRLRRAGFRIILDKALKVKHLKRWTFATLLRADIFDRALPWSRLIVERGAMVDDLNLRLKDRACGVLVGLAFTLCIVFALALLVLSHFSFALLAGIVLSLLTVFLFNIELHRFLEAQRGVWFSIKSFAMLVLYYFYSGAVFALCYCTAMWKKVVVPLLSPRKAKPQSLNNAQQLSDE
jgi:glycosyltransferase involved in cell wall biosynthesis